jgi:hypothetical protein
MLDAFSVIFSEEADAHIEASSRDAGGYHDAEATQDSGKIHDVSGVGFGNGRRNNF